ncbi:GILT-like protein 1 [Rhodnius prolixus]|uniref:Gamma-interferon-inducible lysosomal thiol reductase n=2 Tax=Rhodnius prolixus TaxID=13249 RepID=T1HC64_RHOPR
MLVTKIFTAILITISICLLILTLTYFIVPLALHSNVKKPQMTNIGLPYCNEEETIVRVTVFYECLCPDSREFFQKQLLPTIMKMPENITTELIPYGKASTEIVENNSSYRFHCQHGPSECEGNKLHGCIVHLVEDNLKLVRIISCMFNEYGRDAEIIGKECIEMYNIDWIRIKSCADNGVGDQLLKENGEITERILVQTTFIPTILLNRKLYNQQEVLYNFEEMILNILVQ